MAITPPDSTPPSLTVAPSGATQRAQQAAQQSARLAADLAAFAQNAAIHEAIAVVAQQMATALAAGQRVFSCGNGGSLCDAMHFAEELSGRFRHDRPPLAALAIADAGHLSCVANDYGYEWVFARYLQAHGRAGDVLLALSTSGRSKNVVRAAETARDQGLVVVALTGHGGTPLEAVAHHTLCTPAGEYADRIQVLHLHVIHLLIELIEHALARPAIGDHAKTPPVAR